MWRTSISRPAASPDAPSPAERRPILVLPGYPTREQERTLRQLGFTEFIRTVEHSDLLAPFTRYVLSRSLIVAALIASVQDFQVA